MDTLRLPGWMIERMVEHAVRDLPNEACGIIAGNAEGNATRIWLCRNAEASPFRYTIHPLDFRDVDDAITEYGWKLLVIYHSHVKHEAKPSETDIRTAKWRGIEPPADMFPDTYYVLVSLRDRDKPEVKAWTIAGNDLTEHELETVDAPEPPGASVDLTARASRT